MGRRPVSLSNSPALQRQSILANQTGRYGYGVLNGRSVPEQFIEIFPLDGVDQVVLTSDGYLRAEATLALAEHRLAASLAADPLRIHEHPATKGIRPGAASFDDRTYLRLNR